MPESKPIILAMALAVCCPARGFAEAYSDAVELDADSRTRTVELRAEAGWSTLRGRLVARVRAGSLFVTLVDPSGETRLSGRCDDGRMSLDTGETEAVPGVWKLRIEPHEARGSYRIEWRGDDPPTESERFVE